MNDASEMFDIFWQDFGESFRRDFEDQYTKAADEESKREIEVKITLHGFPDGVAVDATGQSGRADYCEESS